MSREFAALAHELNGPPGPPVEPRPLVRVLQEKFDFLSVHEQQDANEFLVLLLDMIRDEQHGSSTGLNSEDCDEVRDCLSTPIDIRFAFVLKTTTRCEDCNHESVLYSRTTILSLFIPIGGGATTINECLRIYFSPAAGDERMCERCKRPCECAMTPAFETFPHVLGLHLSRFRIKGDHYIKNNIKVQFPEILRLDDIVGFEITYRMIGFVSHWGTIEGGHYTSIARVRESFVEFDDTHTFRVDPRKILDIQAYVIFYERYDGEPEPTPGDQELECVNKTL
jgi:ubiquitin carboxyl-terminal hydrolase 22/27/51